MSSAEKIPACPFCGDQESLVIDVDGRNDRQVICSCGASGPKARNKAAAVVLWNRVSEVMQKWGNT